MCLYLKEGVLRDQYYSNTQCHCDCETRVAVGTTGSGQ